MKIAPVKMYSSAMGLMLLQTLSTLLCNNQAERKEISSIVEHFDMPKTMCCVHCKKNEKAVTGELCLDCGIEHDRTASLIGMENPESLWSAFSKCLSLQFCLNCAQWISYRIL